jgi:hypothetical protein
MLKCKKFIIDWTPKAGCTIVKKIWFDYMDVLNEALKHEIFDETGRLIKGWVHNFDPIFLKRFGGATSGELESNNFIKIKYVRNPYDRAVSSYIHGCLHKLFENCEYMNPSFYEFLELLINKKLCINAGGNHWMIQNRNPNIKYDEIIKIENLENETKKLNQKYNINLKFNFESSHHVKKKNKIDKFFNVPAFDIKKYREKQEVPTYDSFYNDEIKEMVYEIYKTDIEAYGYKQ